MAKTFKQLADEIKNKLIEKGLQIKRVDIDDEDLNLVGLYFSDQGASFVSGEDAEIETPEDKIAIDANCKIVAEVIEGTDLKDIDTEVLDHTVDYVFEKKDGVEGVQYDGEVFMIWLKPSEEVEDEESYPYSGE